MASLQYPIITKYGSLKTYKENYQKDLEVYLEEDEDNREIYYLEKDLLAHEEYLEHLQTKEIEIDEVNEQRVNEPIEARETRKEIIRARHELNYIKNERKINRNKNIIKFIVERIRNIDNDNRTLATTKIQKKTLNDFIFNINEKETFIQELKNTFPTERGKSIKAMIDILTEAQIIIYGTKEFLHLYTVIQNYFKQNIGTYQSIQNIKTIDKETTNAASKKLKPLIDKYKTS
jgi:hypothetical protein